MKEKEEEEVVSKENKEGEKKNEMRVSPVEEKCVYHETKSPI